jgi:hypothetical protein
MANKGARILLTLLLIAFGASCASEGPRKVRVELPTGPAVKLEEYKEFIVTDFREEAETKDFDLNKELVDYFSFEVGKKFKGKVTQRKTSPEKEAVWEDKSFWKNAGADYKEALFLTGSVRFIQETRKALLEGDRKPVDGPFKEEKRTLSERKLFTLTLNLFLIRADTGEIIFKNDYKETKAYANTNQIATFAFSDLVQRVKMKFFRNILGTDRIQERYLISHD